METPTNTTRQDREQLNLVERNTLLPAEHAENKSNPEINISRTITVSVNTSTPIRERMLFRQSKDMARNLFTKDNRKVKGMSQVVTVRQEDLPFVCGLGSESE